MSTPSIGLVGGTGPEGRGLALRFALAGRTVLIGSRRPERAEHAAARVMAGAPGRPVSGADNSEVAARADIVFIAVPYEGQRPTLETLGPSLAGKLVVSVVAPIAFESGIARAVRVPEGSAAVQAALLLPGSRVAAAFHNLSARDLLAPERSVDSDVIVFSDDEGARGEVAELVGLIPGARAIDGGPLESARYAEDLTALLLNINRIHRAHASIRITGL